MTKSLLPLALLLLTPLVSAETVRYVTDSLKLDARTGPSTGHRIVRMIQSGSQVTELERREGYSRIRLPGGQEAWILSRYLMDQPAARDTVAEAQEALERLEAENTQLKSRLERILTKGEATATDLTEYQSENQRLTQELAEIRRTAAEVLSINQQNQELQERVVILERELQLARQENQSLVDNSEREWFVTGAGVLFGGMILGFVIPRMRLKKRRGWREL